MIVPTIGRRVWFWPNSRSGLNSAISTDQPFDAGVVYVHSSRRVNLSVTDHLGRVFSVLNVRLLQDDDVAEATEAYAQWMPYQSAAAVGPHSKDLEPRISALERTVAMKIAPVLAPGKPEEPLPSDLEKMILAEAERQKSEQQSAIEKKLAGLGGKPASSGPPAVSSAPAAAVSASPATAPGGK